MGLYNSYDVILQSGESEQDALDFAADFVFSECELTEQTIKYGQYVDTVNSVDVYYDYGADYYFFVDNSD